MPLWLLSTGRTKADWERRLLLGLCGRCCGCRRGDVRRIRQRMAGTAWMPAGTAGRGSLVRLLVAGDSRGCRRRRIAPRTKRSAAGSSVALSRHILATQARSAFGPA